MIYLQDPDVTIHQGDALELLKGMPSGSVHMACTSPPFYGLRDYGTGRWEGGRPDCDHVQTVQRPSDKSTLEDHGPDGRSPQLDALPGIPYRDTCGKCGATRIDQQIGLEATPDEWVSRLVDVFRELRRVLRDDGSLWLEIGDSYASAFSCARRNIIGEGSPAPDVERPNRLTGDLKEKDLIGAPWLLAFALRADGWYLRSEIIWAKPNPMPESVSDRPTVSHSRVFLLTKSARYFYDAEAIAEATDDLLTKPRAFRNGDATSTLRNDEGNAYTPRGTRNRRSVWRIPTEPYPEAHFATWPTRLVEPMILAGTSEKGVCPECGAQWERIVETGKSSWEARKALGHKTSGYHAEDGAISSFANPDIREAPEGVSTGGLGWVAPRTTAGWERSCGHDWQIAISPATILDPFGGSGTTALVARKHGRRAILLELNEDYCALAARRLQQLSLFAGEHA